MDYGFTADVEKQFDEIAQGEVKWNKMIADFYKPFHKQVEDTAEHSEKVSGERLLGVDPASGKKVYVKLGRFGPMVQKGDAQDEEKPAFASLKKGMSMEEISLEQALELFKLPRVVGTYEGEEIIAAAGRFGPYIKYKGGFVSIPKTDDPLSISVERAMELVKAKAEAEQKKVIRTFDEEPELHILNGRYGPYISFENKNYRIPKGSDANLLTLEDCRKIISEEKPSARSARKAAAISQKKAAEEAKTTKSTAKKASGTKTSKAAASKTASKTKTGAKADATKTAGKKA